MHIDGGEVKECEERLKIGGERVHLDYCVVCGEFACWDNAPHIDVPRHYEETDHPVAQSVESGEKWNWRYPDQVMTLAEENLHL